MLEIASRDGEMLTTLKNSEKERAINKKKEFSRFLLTYSITEKLPKSDKQSTNSDLTEE